MTTTEILKKAKKSKYELLKFGEKEINSALEKMADELLFASDTILCENEKDLTAARTTLGDVMIDRLRLTEDRISSMADGIRELIMLPYPIGKVMSEERRPNGILIKKVKVPFGVIGIIYESRPNVTSDAAALALKSGNAVVLRGGKEAYNTSAAIVDALRRGLRKAGLPEDAVQLISDTSRESAKALMTARGYIDLLIPRGGKSLISACVENATVPTIETGTGICHIYVAASADIDMALNIIENAKSQRPSVCNAAEVCIVHSDIASEFLPKLKARLSGENSKHPIELILDEGAKKIIDGTPANEDSFDTEFLDYKMAVKLVDSTEEAIEHIEKHSTKHSDAIITSDRTEAEIFTHSTDSAAVYVNASTRFTDGGVFGLGCEMGISTQKMHARGPMGIEELTSYKYIVEGCGQTRE